LRLHDRAKLRPSIPDFLSRRFATVVARHPSLPTQPRERRCDRVRDHLYLAVSGVWLNLRFRLAVVELAVVRPTAPPVLTPVAAAPRPLVSGYLARGAPAPYHKTQAAVGPVQDQFPLSPAPFCGASGARSSICACLACNTPVALRATCAVTKVPSLTARPPVD
jgi:hypothetical protein